MNEVNKKTTLRKEQPIIYIILMLAGVIALVWISTQMAPTLRIRAIGNTTQGVVVARDEVRTRPGHADRAYITITYQVEEQIFTGQLSSFEEAVGRLRIGDYVTLFYDPEDLSRVTTGTIGTFSIILVVSIVGLMVAMTAMKVPKKIEE